MQLNLFETKNKMKYPTEIEKTKSETNELEQLKHVAVFSKRSTGETIRAENQLIESKSELLCALNAVQNYMLVVNGNRQVVYVNKAFLEFLQMDNAGSVIGLRIGEIAKCLYSSLSLENCGETEDCMHCGIANTMLKSQLTNKQVKEECRLLLKDNRAFEFLTVSSPLKINDIDFMIVSLTDISDVKKEKALERIFFHDILNSAGALSEYLNLFDLNDLKETEELLSLSQKISKNLIDEIKSHKQLTEIENDDYEITVSTFDATDILFDVVDKVKFSFLAENKSLEITGASKMKISTDRTILGRVVFNLIKNALEATKNGDSVEMSCILNDGNIEYRVKNNSVIPPNVRSQIFYRFFSTKGKGRGIGTYSIKLLTEKYLHGKVFFESDEINGTIFHVVIPINNY